MFVQTIRQKNLLTLYIYIFIRTVQSQRFDGNELDSSHISMNEKNTKPTFDGNRVFDDHEKASLNYPSIQYAPLALNYEEQLLQEKTKADSKLSVPAFNINPPKTNKNNIEPYRQDKERLKIQSNDATIFGHNIEILLPKNTYPTFNDVSINNIEPTTKESFNQVDYDSRNSFYKNKYSVPITKVPSDMERLHWVPLANSPKVDPINPFIVSNYNNKNVDYKNEMILSEKETELIQLQLNYAKPYRLHLNVARAFNAANAPHNSKAKLINKKSPIPLDHLRKHDSMHFMKTSDLKTKRNKYIQQAK